MGVAEAAVWSLSPVEVTRRRLPAVVLVCCTLRQAQGAAPSTTPKLSLRLSSGQACPGGELSVPLSRRCGDAPDD
jgi:hypothetical protein